MQGISSPVLRLVLPRRAQAKMSVLSMARECPQRRLVRWHKPQSLQPFDIDAACEEHIDDDGHQQVLVHTELFILENR